MPAVRLAQQLHQLQVELVAEAGHRPRHRAQGVRVHREIDLVASGVWVAARIAEHAELDLPATQAVEKRLCDVAAVVHLPLDYPGTGLTLPAKVGAEQNVVPERQVKAFLIDGSRDGQSLPPSRADWRVPGLRCRAQRRGRPRRTAPACR